MQQKQSAHLQHTIIIYCAIGIFVIGTIVAIAGISPLYNRLKTDQQRNLSFAVHTRSIGRAMDKVLNKETGILISNLDKEQPVIVAYAPIKNSEWVLIVKMDKQELYGSINSQITTVALG